MVDESSCNGIAITGLLKRKYPLIAKQIDDVCCKTRTVMTVIENANDLWCRDFMPVQVRVNKYVQFTYDPSYYKNKRYGHLKTYVRRLGFKFGAPAHKSTIVLDGGNISFCNSAAIITERIFKDNEGYPKEKLVNEIVELLELKELTFVPPLPYDVTGHADGMIRFIDEKTVLLNDFRLIAGKTYWRKLLKSLSKFRVILLPNDLHLNSQTDNATGDYINMAIIKDRLLVPEYNTFTDKLAHEIIRLAYPHSKMVPVMSNGLAREAGILHCATWNYLFIADEGGEATQIELKRLSDR